MCRKQKCQNVSLFYTSGCSLELDSVSHTFLIPLVIIILKQIFWIVSEFSLHFTKVFPAQPNVKCGTTSHHPIMADDHNMGNLRAQPKYKRLMGQLNV